jgi:hypothetical protein
MGDFGKTGTVFDLLVFFGRAGQSGVFLRRFHE